ncbi:MAG: response regulator [Deltaproteobacteria bacterium]|nr:MAG: response regulator [Deltaproteobacteria bacterium]
MKYHILIVEDESTLLRGLVRGLGQAPNLHITGCATYQEGLNVLLHDTPDLLLTDLNLPDRSGFDFLNEMNAHNIRIPVLVMTAYRAVFAPQLSQNPGLTVLEKPIGLKELRQAIDEKLSFYETAKPIGPFQLADYLQISGMGRHTLSFLLELEEYGQAEIDIVEGDIWNVRLGTKTGKEALQLCLSGTIRNIGYRQRESELQERQIYDRWEELLLDMLRQEDEANRVELEWQSQDELFGIIAESMTELPAAGEPPKTSDDAHIQLVNELKPQSNVLTVEPEEYTDMANVNAVCQEVVGDVTDALACGVVDLSSGMLMGVHHTVPYFTQSYLDAVAAAAVDLFRGKNVRRVEQLLGKHRGATVQDSFQEIFVSSDNVYHFMKIIPAKGAVVVLVTRKTTNQGMGWASLRSAVTDIASAL